MLYAYLLSGIKSLTGAFKSNSALESTLKHIEDSGQTEWMPRLVLVFVEGHAVR